MHNPFGVGNQLLALDSGLVDVEQRLTCDKSEEIGAAIQKEMDGKTYSSCSFKRKNQISTLQSLYSSVSIGTENVTIDPLTLFLRLIVMVEKKTENEIVDYFNYELSPYPMSLFKEGIMRSAQKSKLKQFLLKTVNPTDAPQTTRIADGGALLWCCDWKRNELFATIFNKYSQFLAHHKIDTVVFDGYTLSTKDATHQKRSGKISQTVDISDDNRCPSDRNTFFSNYTNKESFVKSLAKKLKPTFKVIECPSDADTTIVKEALAVALDAPVTVFSDDTDILCLLVHHANKMSRNKLRNILLTDMTKKKKQQREYYNVKDVIDKFYADVVDYLLFAHAFTGCDTTSAIHMFGKTSIFRKLSASSALRSIADNFYNDLISPQEVGNATIRFFESLHSASDNMSKIRKMKYEEMVMSDRSNIDPSLLPPSPRAAFYHGLRVYHQVKIWRDLKDSDFMPLHWG